VSATLDILRPVAKPNCHLEKKKPRVSRRKFVLEMLDTNITLDTIFEPDDEEDV
jgi:hypothetical protein